MSELPDIDAQAARWATRLEWDSAPQTLREHRAWLAQSAEHREAFRLTEEAWEAANVIRGPVVVATVSKPSPFRTYWRYAALFVLVICGYGLFESFSSVTPYETEVGDIREFTLEDGSRMVLNTDTAVDVEFSPLGRSVLLRRGEALFDVEKDPVRNFYVRAGGSLISSVGTRFSTRDLGNGSVRVAVAEGRVRSSGRLVRSGDVVTITTKHFKQESVGIGRVEEMQAWTSGWIEFRKERVADVVAEANRYSGPQLVIRDASVSDLRITARFRVSDLEGVAAALRSKLNITVDLSKDDDSNGAQIHLAERSRR